MSARKPRAKKQRVERQADTQRPVNTFGLVASKSLPQHLELLVLSFLEPHELYELPEVSKDVGKLAVAYFSQVREWSFATLPATVPRVLRSCRQLQSLCIQYAYNDQEPLEDVAAMIRDNAETLRRFECHFCFPMCVVEALAGCASLTAVDGLGHCRTSRFEEYNSLVQKASDGWRQISQLGLSLQAGSSGAAQLSSETVAHILSKDWPLQRLTVEGPVADLLPLLAGHSRLHTFAMKKHMLERGRSGEIEALGEWLPKLPSLHTLEVAATRFPHWNGPALPACTWVLPGSLTSLRFCSFYPANLTFVTSSLTSLRLPRVDLQQAYPRSLIESNPGLRDLTIEDSAASTSVLQLAQLERLETPGYRYPDAAFTASLPVLFRLRHLDTGLHGVMADAVALISKLPGLQSCMLKAVSAFQKVVARTDATPIFAPLTRPFIHSALTELHLSGFDASLLKLRLPNLTTLHLEVGAPGFGAPQLERLALSTPRLRSLSLTGFASTASLRNALPHWPPLQSLSLDSSRAKPKLLTEWTDKGWLARLTTLKLKDFVRDYAFLADLVRKLPLLVDLDLNLFEDEAADLRKWLPAHRARVMRLHSQERKVFSMYYGDSDNDEEADF